MAARAQNVTKFRMGEEHRTKIANSRILSCLLEHVEGKRDMSSTLVTAALGLLRKVLPDLQASENKTEVTIQSVMRMPAPPKTVDEWQSQISSRH
jgi:hypothetical protein